MRDVYEERARHATPEKGGLHRLLRACTYMITSSIDKTGGITGQRRNQTHKELPIGRRKPPSPEPGANVMERPGQSGGGIPCYSSVRHCRCSLYLRSAWNSEKRPTKEIEAQAAGGPFTFWELPTVSGCRRASDHQRLRLVGREESKSWGDSWVLTIPANRLADSL